MIENPVYVYIAGPLTIGDREANIINAIDAAEVLRNVSHRIVPFVPHLADQWAKRYSHHPGWEYWLAYDLAWLRKCDYLLLLPGDSVGAQVEVIYAKDHGIPVVTNVEDILIQMSRDL